MNCHQCRHTCHPNPSKRRPPWWRWSRKQKLPRSFHLPQALPKIALVGMPNVGKSALFNALTGSYVTVSNYPGTTVEVSQGQTVIGEQVVSVVDTPGMYSLLPITEEEKVARDLLLSTAMNLVIHVVDAKNLGRMLPLTFQLIEAGLPVLLVLNMMDEARHLQIHIQTEPLAAELGIPVLRTIAATNVGIRELKTTIASYVYTPQLSATY
ncbi:FeoB small GTPase domain-containing protein [Pantanalinema sp. GBBB05]|uniref:FeoB small GTPase domain-containing protein n=1 Tax=Pantanalinema sp. GBBB05 TaxID=2604139 RepID=UPI001DA1B38C|nr:GTP-binding protein [Pantanalinema sp. GBBB05]